MQDCLSTKALFPSKLPISWSVNGEIIPGIMTTRMQKEFMISVFCIFGPLLDFVGIQGDSRNKHSRLRLDALVTYTEDQGPIVS